VLQFSLTVRLRSSGAQPGICASISSVTSTVAPGCFIATRDAWIVVDEKIKGGTAVIRGTRMTVYSVLGRIEHGDSVNDVLADNPDLSRVAIEAAIVYARTHPLMGRPGGRPWADAA
jgi:uncharacterized protein (DUF433 family)